MAGVSAVHAAYLVGSAIVSITAVGTVKPDFKDLSILGRQFFELFAEVFYVGWPAILGMVAIPWREVDPEPEVVLPACVGYLAHYITLAITPRTVLHGVFGVFRGPEAEAVVVLAGQNQSVHPRFCCRADDLVRIESSRCKHGG